ncbi:transmembrane protein (plasmid) [Legionella adelaidensis]|uniref:Transmembrane protein n=1 Tax=Legionella adelaidensis TaxID=45056 RepID=A0A0W0R547_9GAMM|nr:hypothetical protein [Legionella adelaidensis]KTC66142.1 transmembrane protein [Legionella adelaidensis]VEH85654.1 transmembrane protein [Legionella adelaidensis]
MEKIGSNNLPQQVTSHTLGLKNIYILPSAFGWVFAFVVLTISTGAINYQLNPAFFLFFLLIVFGSIALWETHYNLNGLTIHCLPILDTEVGQPAKITLLLKSDLPKRFAIYFKFEGEEEVKIEIAYPNGIVIVPIETKKRGKFHLPPLKIYSYYPIGIFKVWTYSRFSNEYYVYPKPLNPGFWPNPFIPTQQASADTEQTGEDELYDLKLVGNPWTQPGRIAWKISARGQGWFLKTMSSPTGENWIFRLQDLPKDNGERNLQYIAFWLLEAEGRGHIYGLELKGERTEITRGEQHLKNCLRKLASY